MAMSREDFAAGGDTFTGLAQSVRELGRQGRDALKLDRIKMPNEKQVAIGLAWFSIGLGLTELLAPRAVAKIAGINGRNNGLIRLFGLREIAHGVGILSQKERPVGAVWSRVFGDALDIAALGRAFISPGSKKTRVALATANVLGITALDLLTSQQLGRHNGATNAAGDIKVNTSVFINRSPAELYEYWRNFENLPLFMHHLESVRVSPDGTSQWTAKAPAGAKVDWHAVIVEDRPSELISWRSLPGSRINNRGTVRFERAPGNRGSYLKVEIEYTAPAGFIGAGVARLFREEPIKQLQDDLRRFKQIMEIGEVVRSEGSPCGMGSMPQRPARPVADNTNR